MISDLEYTTEDLEEGPDEQGPYLYEGCQVDGHAGVFAQEARYVWTWPGFWLSAYSCCRLWFSEIGREYEAERS